MFKFGKQMDPDRPIGLDDIVNAQGKSDNDPMNEQELDKESNIQSKTE